MGTYTTNYQLLKAGDGTVDPVDDYVDVISQVDRNFSLIDDFGYRAVEYATYDNVNSDNLPLVGNRSGDKLFTNYDHSAKVWNGSAWVSTNCKAPVWLDVAPTAGFETTVGCSNPGYYIENDTVYLRGVINKISFAIWVQGANTAVFPSGSFPVPPGGGRSFLTTGGRSTSNVAQMYYVVLPPSTGAMTISRYGANTQTAASTENWVSLEGIHYGLS
jgi:hypothetical protein